MRVSLEGPGTSRIRSKWHAVREQGTHAASLGKVPIRGREEAVEILHWQHEQEPGNRIRVLVQGHPG
jgi:hypothetical protein